MLGSIFIGLSGMNAYSGGLQTISNNVANLNTPGFKTTSVLFGDLFAFDNGSEFLGSTFGKNGSGVHIGSSLINFEQGELRQTGGALDLAIEGDGFLVLLKDDNTFYTRTGQFAVDKDGYISEQGTGYHLAILDDTGHAVPVNLDLRQIDPPVASTKVTFAGNLSSDVTSFTIDDIAVFDSLGTKHVWEATFTRGATVGTETEWTVTVEDAAGNTLSTSTVKFDGGTIDPTTSQFTVTDTPAGADALSVTFDLATGVTSFNGGTSSSLDHALIDGNAIGTLTSVGLDEDGQVKLTYSNGKTDTAGSVALADFRDSQAMTQIGNGLLRASHDAIVHLRASAGEGVGRLVSQQIEASNVDLAGQFGDLILVQRGFQACSQVVSVANDMIQQLFGIRGQG
jgi:flagellar hook protein FlgE